MTDGADPAAAASIEAAMREQLARSDAAVGAVAPILRHLLANDDHALFSDEIVARVRGMIGDLAAQLLGDPPGESHDPARVVAVAAALLDQPAVLAHVHALALEWQLAERLQSRQSLDPVLSPLLQELIASPDPAIAATAMALLAAQARFAQAQRRMQLPLTELPGDLAHLAFSALRTAQPGAASEAPLRERFDEARSRLGLIARLVTALGAGAGAALAVNHAGLAMFLSALALASAQDREAVIVASTDGQAARLALTLRAAGLKPALIDEQFAALLPDVPPPQGIETLGAARAAALLARNRP